MTGGHNSVRQALDNPREVAATGDRLQVVEPPTIEAEMRGPMGDEERLAVLFRHLMAIEDERDQLRERAGMVRAAAKAVGFDTTILTQVVRRARQDAALVAERDIMLAMYAEALGQVGGPGAVVKLVSNQKAHPATSGKRGNAVAAALAWAGE